MLERQMGELARSNSELEQFAYVASHDLSEPLRAISGPISLLAHKYQGQLDDDADALITFAVDGCLRMQALIDGLLSVSRVGRLDGDFDDIDLNAVMDGVLIALGPMIDDAGATVTVEGLPHLRADPTQMAQVLQNLVANAVKFVAPGIPPAVDVSATCESGVWRIDVTDNGIGIPEAHRRRIFGIFKRLHGRAAYPGTGIGLALVEKIVERHLGTVGVEDNPQGAGKSVLVHPPPGTGNTRRRHETRAMMTPEPPSTTGIRPLRILLVEDSPSDVAMTVDAFREGRIVTDVSVATDGEMAVAMLRREGTFRDAWAPGCDPSGPQSPEDGRQRGPRGGQERRRAQGHPSRGAHQLRCRQRHRSRLRTPCQRLPEEVDRLRRPAEHPRWLRGVLADVGVPAGASGAVGMSRFHLISFPGRTFLLCASTSALMHGTAGPTEQE